MFELDTSFEQSRLDQMHNQRVMNELEICRYLKYIYLGVHEEA
ncbi:hypothetical protein BD31_I0907 [Candidatus Nitrosopumilus salaria BD31]|uniref:Uncharacterized protein n=1 Tax=Candidatus Nitrosopumilus salarius BD31 TaxID=859350 RepID=I3CZN3_9ARCH|nr:hypothetical protein BD31_I0907 [Candidatus Nitrosopumilus salaria BD31]